MYRSVRFRRNRRDPHFSVRPLDQKGIRIMVVEGIQERLQHIIVRALPHHALAGDIAVARVVSERADRVVAPANQHDFIAVTLKRRHAVLIYHILDKFRGGLGRINHIGSGNPSGVDANRHLRHEPAARLPQHFNPIVSKFPLKPGIYTGRIVEQLEILHSRNRHRGNRLKGSVAVLTAPRPECIVVRMIMPVPRRRPAKPDAVPLLEALRLTALVLKDSVQLVILSRHMGDFSARKPLRSQHFFIHIAADVRDHNLPEFRIALLLADAGLQGGKFVLFGLAEKVGILCKSFVYLRNDFPN